jgi:hypothetical protein
MTAALKPLPTVGIGSFAVHGLTFAPLVKETFSSRETIKKMVKTSNVLNLHMAAP